MTQIYEEYKKEMELATAWNPEVELGFNTAQTKKEHGIAFVESAGLSNHFELVVDYKRQQVMAPQQTPQGIIQIPQEQVVWRIIDQGWK